MRLWISIIIILIKMSIIKKTSTSITIIILRQIATIPTQQILMSKIIKISTTTIKTFARPPLSKVITIQEMPPTLKRVLLLKAI